MTIMAADIQDEILHRLKKAEDEHKVKILYACESGSRAWGFASDDSDYDVRFLYAHPTEWYLSYDVEKRRDVIEYPIVDDIDCNGWDIRKALYLFTRTNGALIEWLNSPIKYIEVGDFAQSLRDYADQVFNEVALCYHYSHMARRNAAEYLFKDQVYLKKYFYVLRPLLAINYIQAHHRPPPVVFEQLVASVAPKSIIPMINALLEKKRRSPELGIGDPVPEINHFVQQELARHADTFTGPGRPDLMENDDVNVVLNRLFRNAIAGV